MRFLATLILAGLWLGWGGALAQSRADIERCRAMAEDAERLRCYDAIELPRSPLSKYELVELSELKDFALSYRGNLVEVSGWIVPGADLMMLGLDENDPTPLPVEFGNLSRRDREAFLQACGKGCRATVQGRVRPVNFTTGIVADALIAR